MTARDQLNGEIVVAGSARGWCAYREKVAREKRLAFRDWDYWGKPVPGLRRPARGVVDSRPGARRARRESHRPHVHRRPLGRFSLQGALSRRIREPAALRPPRRRPRPQECLHLRDRFAALLRRTSRCRRNSKLPPLFRKRTRDSPARARFWRSAESPCAPISTC